METTRSLAELLSSYEPKDTGVVLRVPDSEKQQLQALAGALNLNLSDLIRQALYYYVWATSELELEPIHINQEPEFIDLQNRAQYSIYLRNYLITDDTFNNDETRTNKHQHSFHFGPLVLNYLTGHRHEAVLHPGEIVRVFSQEHVPPSPPRDVAIWTSLPGKIKIWNNQLDRVTIYKIARKESENIIAGVPSKRLGGLLSLTMRDQALK